MIGGAFIARYALAAALALAAAGWAAAGVQTYRIKGMKLEAAESLLKATQDARAREQLAAIEQNRITDALLEKNAATALDRDAVSERLRKLSAGRSELAARCAASDEAAASLIPDRTRADLVAQALRANEVVNQLTAAQEAIVSARKACSVTP